MVIAIDTETFFSKKLKYSIRGLIAEQYCQHELFDCYMVSVSDGTQCWSGHPRDFNWSSLEGAHLLSHNASFDQQVIREMLRRKQIPSFTPKEWDCTANLTSFICNQRALDNAVEQLFGVTLSKAERSDAVEKHWPNDFSATEQKAMLAYAQRDAQWCWNLWDKFSDKWPENERILSRLTIDQGARGIQIDTALLDEYICAAHEMKRAAEKLLPWLEEDASEEWDGFNLKPSSSKCIAEQCRRCGIPCCPVKSDDEEAYELWETTYSVTQPWILAVGAWRSINKLYQTFLTVKSRLRKDGTMPFGLKYAGAHTLRWSGDSKVNMQNLRRIPAFSTHSGLLQQDDKAIAGYLKHHKEHGKWPSEVRHALDFRALLLPRPGKKMIISDLAQIEPRVLAWLSGNTEMLDQIKAGQSVYEAFARTNFGYSGGKMDKSTTEYKLIKIQVLQLGYGCGADKFISTAMKEMGLDLTASDPEKEMVIDKHSGAVTERSGKGAYARKLVADFRAASPKITALWKKLEDGFRSSIGQDFVMELPSGRKMIYRNVRAQTRIEKSKKDGKPYFKTEYTAEVGGRRIASYGGKLVENATQAVARDVFADGIVRMHKNSWPILWSSHDEAILEVDDSVTTQMVENAMSVTPDWIPGLPVAAEAKIVERYCK